MYKIPANTLFMGQKLIYVPECHSTNSLLNDLNDSSALPEGTVLITDRQTAGRGQRGNSWEAAPGQNLTFSILLRPGFLELKDQFKLNMSISLAVVEALRFIGSANVKLKWPNDIFIENKKVGGILIENQVQGPKLACSIAGIGLNINQQSFLTPDATSVYIFTGIESNLNSVFQGLIESLEGEYLDLRGKNSASLKRRYLKCLYKFNDSHQFESEGEKFTGVIHDIDDNGRLCVESDGVNRTFSFKEVRFLNG
ncbi:biotin--[acetyl-CoA-carboxylase] ligase [soil metagenome]